MDYSFMWRKMKITYQTRLAKLESEGKKGTTAWINAKRFVDVMTGFELGQTDIDDNGSDGLDDYHFRRYKEEKLRSE